MEAPRERRVRLQGRVLAGNRHERDVRAGKPGGGLLDAPRGRLLRRLRASPPALEGLLTGEERGLGALLRLGTDREDQVVRRRGGQLPVLEALGPQVLDVGLRPHQRDRELGALSLSHGSRSRHQLHGIHVGVGADADQRDAHCPVPAPQEPESALRSEGIRAT